jgi:predicted ATPase
MNSNIYIREIKLKKINTADSERYPFNLSVVRNLTSLPFNSPVTFFVGENGTGKSTLLEEIALNFGFNPEGGSRNFNFSTHLSHSVLHDFITLVKGVTKPQDGYFLRAESFYNVATEFDKLEVMDSYGGKSLHEQSHGESTVQSCPFSFTRATRLITSMGFTCVDSSAVSGNANSWYEPLIEQEQNKTSESNSKVLFCSLSSALG